MEKISSIELYKAKEKCLELEESNQRLILKGNSPILLTTTILKTNEDSKVDYSMFEVSSTARENNLNNSYLDALILHFNKEYDINGIIDYLPVTDNMISIMKQLTVNKYYSDCEIRKFILAEKIHLLQNYKVGGTVANEPIALGEKISSYSFMGLTGVTKKLSELLDKNNLPNHMEFGGSYSNKEFNDLGYDFTDDTIDFYSEIFKLGIIKGKNLPPEKIWPRTTEVNFAKEEDTYNLERIASSLIEYYKWVEQELKEKGPNNAMSPMQLTYKKN